MTEEFNARLAARYDELKWLYCEIYEGRGDTLAALISAMEQAWPAQKA